MQQTQVSAFLPLSGCTVTPLAARFCPSNLQVMHTKDLSPFALKEKNERRGKEPTNWPLSSGKYRHSDLPFWSGRESS